MLHYNRRVKQSLHIGDNIVITVLEITAHTVRLGITAPREVPVYREELLPIRAKADTLPPGADTRKRGA